MSNKEKGYMATENVLKGEKQRTRKEHKITAATTTHLFGRWTNVVQIQLYRDLFYVNVGMYDRCRRQVEWNFNSLSHADIRTQRLSYTHAQIHTRSLLLTLTHSLNNIRIHTQTHTYTHWIIDDFNKQLRNTKGILLENSRDRKMPKIQQLEGKKRRRNI